MSFKAAELCLLLVEENYGELPTTQHGLALLIQQNLARWSADPQNDLIFYEADWLAAYALARSGKLLKAVENRLGNDVGSIFRELFLLGHVRVGDLERVRTCYNGTVLGHKGKTTTTTHISAKINGKMSLSSELPAEALSIVYDSVYSLLQTYFLCVAHEAHFRPEEENYALAEEAAREIPKFAGKIKKDIEADFMNAVKGNLRSWLQGSTIMRAAIKERNLEQMHDGLKRQLEDESDDEDEGRKPAKRRRGESGDMTINGVSNQDFGPSHSRLDPELVVRVNSHKVAVTARTDRLVQLAKERIGSITSLVYSSVLKNLEEDIYQCSDSRPDAEALPENEYLEQPCVYTADVVAAIEDFDDLKDSIGKIDAPKREGQSQHRKEHRRKLKSGDEGKEDSKASSGESDGEEHDSRDVDSNTLASDVSMDEGDQVEDTANTKLIQQHLLILCRASLPFLHHHPRTKHRKESWSVPFRELAAHLRLIELNKHIGSIHGRLALRYARVLQEKGKLDEKTIREYTLSSTKEARAPLTAMLKAGHLSLQEVPRDNNRQPARTIWLYFFDAERCAAKVLEELYQAMARCLQRLKVEREGMREVLSKASRTDVAGREEEFLSRTEIEDLRAWKATEERLLAEVGRLDDVVLVLRDFQGIE
ncbi:MAG: hypothetical protein LQ340_004890 [Diploschistes diacapsis]|nr:MAG: hypothetical protein LQ340_004890 [Diploschistes diacapsis]